MGLVALLVGFAVMVVGVLAVVAARGPWRWASLLALGVNGFAVFTLVVVSLLDRAISARNAQPDRYHAGFERWSRLWESMFLWSLLDLLACVMWGLVMVIAAVISMANSAAGVDTADRHASKHGFRAQRARWLLLAHAMLTLCQGVVMLGLVVPYMPSP